MASESPLQTISGRAVPARVRVGVLGAGLGGIATGVRLKQAGIEDFVIVEKSDSIGGTWRDNDYPGCACDVPTPFYSFSFAPKPDWSHLYARQHEIREYIEDVADRFGLRDHIVTGCEVGESRWNDQEHCWQISSSLGDYEADVVISAAGPWNEPSIPDIPGLAEFPGEVFHSSRWNHDHDLTGERVAVLGTGASAVQFVPCIQKQAAQLHVYQRTAHWVLPKADRRIPGPEQQLYRRFPATQKAVRSTIFGLTESLGFAQRNPRLLKPLQKVAERHLARQVKDPQLRALLTPDFTIGCKRTLFSNNWYPALQQPNVEVLGTGVVEVRGNVIVGADGSEREADTIILGTGFTFTDLPIAHRTYGRDGRSMDETWGGSPQAYLGTVVNNFPNLFVLLGPNAGNGHGSAIFLHEAQLDFALAAVAELEQRGAASIEVRREVQDLFNDTVQRRLRESVWNAGGCASYYIDRNGRNSSMYPWSTIRFRRSLRSFDPGAFEFAPARRAASSVA